MNRKYLVPAVLFLISSVFALMYDNYFGFICYLISAIFLYKIQ